MALCTAVDHIDRVVRQGRCWGRVRLGEVIRAITTRMDPARDTMVVEHTPIDYLDFASLVSGLGSKMGMDATNKWPGETQREWGRPMRMDEEAAKRAEAVFAGLGL